ncbi:hypothetical protein H6P81_019925 [Aristolochia fimbriata]|uniref:Uncharacterized protein n=1 Tax=Aristolochia fimbriata TaxID=158543 RepID=A0AAV7DSZ6_ARIFI|nr:hypothetical protein H6P81_019925 [Aristolochia fimbriata]
MASLEGEGKHMRALFGFAQGIGSREESKKENKKMGSLEGEGTQMRAWMSSARSLIGEGGAPMTHGKGQESDSQTGAYSQRARPSVPLSLSLIDPMHQRNPAMKPFTGEKEVGGGGGEKEVTFGGKRRFYAEEVRQKKPKIGDESSSSTSFSSSQEDDALQSSISSTCSVNNRGFGFGFLSQESADDEVSVFDIVQPNLEVTNHAPKPPKERLRTTNVAEAHPKLRSTTQSVEQCVLLAKMTTKTPELEDDCFCIGDNFHMLRQLINAEEKKKRRLTPPTILGVEACICPTFFDVLGSEDYKLKKPDEEFGDPHFWNSLTDITHF